MTKLRGYLPAQDIASSQDAESKHARGRGFALSAAQQGSSVAANIDQALGSLPSPGASSRADCARTDGERGMTGRSYSEPALVVQAPRPKSSLNVVLANLANEQAILQQEKREVGLHRHSRRLSSAGSMASGRSSCSSSCWSQAVRSTVLDLELQLEVERREKAEAELAVLRAKLADGKK